MLVICSAYTALGGMRAVVWTDVFQFIIMFSGMVAILTKGFLVSGGVEEIYESAKNESRLIWADVSPDPTVRHTVWGHMFGLTTTWVVIYGLNQASVQRYCGIVTLSGARSSLLLNIPILTLMICMTFMTGFTVLAYYTHLRCDPITSGQITKTNQMLPLFVKTMFKHNPGFSGFFIATLYSGGLSSVSSCLSGSAAVMWDDIASIKLSHLSPFKASLLNKGFVLMFGVISIGIASIAAELPGPITQINIAIKSSAQGPLLGMFILGAFKSFRWTHPKGVLIGGLMGFVFLFWISLGSRMISVSKQSLPSLPVDRCDAAVNITLPQQHSLSGLEKFYTISYIWYTLFGGIVTVLTGSLASIICNRMCIVKYREIPEYLFIDWANLFRWHTGDTISQDEAAEDVVHSKTVLMVNSTSQHSSKDDRLKGDNVNTLL